MHIVQLLPELNQGGVERGAVELNRELARLGHRSTVISAGGRLVPHIERDGGVHVTLDVCSKNPLTVPNRTLALRRILSSLSPDIVHARSRVPAWLCLFANRNLRLPFVTTVHGFNSVGRYSAVMTRGDRIIYGSTAVKDFILKHYSVDESKLRYVPRGIDVKTFDPDAADKTWIETFRKKHGLEGRFTVTAVGRITGLKGQDDFIRAVAEARKKYPDMIGLIAGGVRHDRQKFYRSLVRLAEELGAKDSICFAGEQSNVREIYSLSNLAVSAASTKPETFGRTAAEALAMNRPVIASAHGGSLDIVQDSVNGFFFEPGNSRDLADKIIQARTFNFSNMRSHILENFTLEHMVHAELAVYEELLKPG